MKTIAAVLIVIAVGTPGWGWWGNGHAILTRAAVEALPAEMPAFFRADGVMPAHCVYDPDLFKNRALPELDNAEFPEHFYDQELMEGRALPATRYGFLDLCAREGLKPRKVGLLPYAVAEWTQRLAVGLAEHRKWPEDKAIQSKCLVYAGFIAHYAEDLCQPLHVTIHYDGRPKADGSLEGKGIHEKVDALVERLEFEPQELAKGQKIVALGELMPAIVRQIEESRALVDRVYELEEGLGDKDSQEVRAFALERARAASGFTAALFLTAWEISAGVKLPGWHQRE
jgi:hypothetical protein